LEEIKGSYFVMEFEIISIFYSTIYKLLHYEILFVSFVANLLHTLIKIQGTSWKFFEILFSIFRKVCLLFLDYGEYGDESIKTKINTMDRE